MVIKLDHVYKLCEGSLELALPSHPLDSLLLMVHLKCGVELSDHGFIPIVIETHDVLQPGTFILGQQPLKRNLLTHDISPNPLLVGTH